MLRWSLVAVCALSACATTHGARGQGGGAASGGGGPPAFPEREKVEALATKPPPAVTAPEPKRAVDAWTLAGPFPERVGDAPMQPGDAVGDVVIAAAGIANTSESLACAAREIGRFVDVDQKTLPEPRLERYLLLRCGTTVESAAFQSLSWANVDAKVTDAQLVEKKAKDALTDVTKKLRANDDMKVGGALVRDNEKKTAMALVVASRPSIALRAATQAPTAGQYILAGTVTAAGGADAFEQMFAYVTKGAFDAVECTRDSTVALPAFGFTCPIDAADATALVEVDGRAHGRLLPTPLGDLLVVQNTAVAASWQRIDYATPTPTPADKTAIAPAVLSLVNDARKQAGAPPLVEVPAQSATATKLAPHYFSSALGPQPDGSIIDLVALGLMAGYDVKDIVIHDAMFASLIDYSGHLDQMLGDALDRPLMRKVFLAKTATSAAIGVQPIDDKITGVLVVGYEPMADIDARQAAASVIAKLDQQRKQRGESETGAISPAADIMLAAATKLRAGDDVNAVGQEALQASVNKMNRRLGMWNIEAYDVDHLTFPEGLLTAHPTYVAVAVAARKRPGAAWGSTTILILYSVDETARSAE